MSIVAGNFMTIVSSQKLEIEILLIQNLTSLKYSEMDILYAPFCFRGVRSTFGHCDDMMMMMIDSRGCGGNIAISLKTAQSHCVEERPPQSFAELSKQAPVESTIVSDYTR